MRRRTRKPAPPPPVVVSDTGRVVVRRAIVGAVLLGVAGAVADWQALGVIDPADVLLGAALGLLAGPLALGERAARLGRPWAALVWCAGLAVVGVLAAAVQAGFAARVLAAGTAKGVHATAHADAWLAALDPSTLRVVLTRALPLALVPVLAGRLGRGGLIAGVVVGGVALPWAVMSLAPPAEPPAVLLGDHGAAWALPTGARATLEAPVDRATWLPGVGVVASAIESAWLRPVVLRATALDALALALTALLADLLAARRRAGPAPPPSRWLPLGRALPTLAVVALAGLTSLRDRSPPTFLVGDLVDHVDAPLRREASMRLLERLGPGNGDAVPVLAAKLLDNASEKRRALAARLLARIGPPAAAAALPELGRALDDPGDDPGDEVRLEVLDALERLGPAGRPLAPDLLRALLVQLGRRLGFPDQRELPVEARMQALLQAWGHLPGDGEVSSHLLEPDQDVLAGAIVLLLRRGALGAEHATSLYAAARRGVAVEAVMDALAGLGAPAVAILRERLVAVDLGPDDPILLVLEHELPAGSDDVYATAAAADLPAARERAARALDAGRSGGRLEGAVELLVPLITDADPRAREAARRSLRSHLRVAAAPLAREVDARGPGAIAAAEILGELGIRGAEAVPALARALASGEPALRLAAARALGRVGGGLEPGEGGDVALDALVAAVQDPDDQVAGQALEALRAFVGGDAEARVVAALIAALDAPVATVRARAAMSLVHGGGATRTRGGPALRSVEDNLERLLPALTGGLEHAALRADALQALSSLGARARPALPAIYELVRPGEDVGHALRAIAAIGLDAPGALAAVASALRFGRVDDRRVALVLIRTQGAAAGEVLDDLAAALLDPAPEVRRDAALALDGVELATLARLRSALEAHAGREDDPQTAGLLLKLLRQLDEAR